MGYGNARVSIQVLHSIMQDKHMLFRETLSDFWEAHTLCVVSGVQTWRNKSKRNMNMLVTTRKFRYHFDIFRYQAQVLHLKHQVAYMLFSKATNEGSSRNQPLYRYPIHPVNALCWSMQRHRGSSAPSGGTLNEWADPRNISWVTLDVTNLVHVQ